MIKIHWWADSNNPMKRSIHKNEPGLSFKESFLGEMWESEEGWVYRLKDGSVSPKVYSHPMTCARALELAVSGSQMDPSED